MSDELKHCPFCGGKRIYTNENKERYVRCYTCGVKTKNFDTIKEAIKRWNAIYRVMD